MVCTPLSPFKAASGPWLGAASQASPTPSPGPAAAEDEPWYRLCPPSLNAWLQQPANSGQPLKWRIRAWREFQRGWQGGGGRAEAVAVGLGFGHMG